MQARKLPAGRSGGTWVDEHRDGKNQRAVSDLFAQTLSELANAGPTILLLNEVETLVVDRPRLSLDAIPVDIHRVTDAVLVQLDMLAETHGNLLFVVTSNYPEAVDDAFVSRCDLVREVPFPGKEASKAFVQGRNDLAIGLFETHPSQGPIGPYISEDLYVEEYVVAGRQDHPFINGEADTCADANEPHLLVASAGVMNGLIDCALDAPGLHRNVHATLTYVLSSAIGS